MFCGIRAGWPTTPRLLNVGSCHVFQIKTEFRGGIGDIPQQVAQVFGNLILESVVCPAVAKVFLVFRQECANLAGQSKQGYKHRPFVGAWNQS